MADKENITFVLTVKNESHRIEWVLKSFQGRGEILILDDGSTDNTREIAKSYGAVIIPMQLPGWVETPEIMDMVMKTAKYDWIYWGFADEILAKKLLEKMSELSRQDKFKVVWARRKNYNYGGVNLENGYALRFFKKGAIDFSQNTIGRFGKIAVSNDEIIYLPPRDEFSIHHFSTYNVDKFELAHNKYSRLEAEDNERSGRKFSAFKLIIRPIYYFLRYMIRGGAWRWGLRGLIIVAQYSFFYFNTYAKMWEMENKITLQSMEDEYSRMKEKLLSK